MNTTANHYSKSINWSTLVMFTLGFWLSASLILDLVIVPGLSASGMMAQSGFAGAGYLIFGVFNHIELLCAALILSSFLVFNRNHNLTHLQERWSIILASLLLIIAVIYTYFLTPQMSGLGLQMNGIDPATSMPTAMIYLHAGYWVLEMIKLLAGTMLLKWCYRDSCSLT